MKRLPIHQDGSVADASSQNRNPSRSPRHRRHDHPSAQSSKGSNDAVDRKTFSNTRSTLLSQHVSARRKTRQQDIPILDRKLDRLLLFRVHGDHSLREHGFRSTTTSILFVTKKTNDVLPCDQIMELQCSVS